MSSPPIPIHLQGKAISVVELLVSLQPCGLRQQSLEATSQQLFLLSKVS